MRYGTYGAWRNSSAADCEATLPMNLRIVYNADKDEYAVKINGGMYLWERRNIWISDSFEPWTTFGDSCRAKSFAIQYIRQEVEKNKINTGFK